MRHERGFDDSSSERMYMGDVCNSVCVYECGTRSACFRILIFIACRRFYAIVAPDIDVENMI